MQTQQMFRVDLRAQLPAGPANGGDFRGGTLPFSLGGGQASLAKGPQKTWSVCDWGAEHGPLTLEKLPSEAFPSELLIWRIFSPHPGLCCGSGQSQGQDCQSDRFGPEKGSSILSESLTHKAWASWHSSKYTISRLTSNTMILLMVNSLSENQRAGHGGGMADFERRKKRPAFLFVRGPAWHSVWESRAAGRSESPTLSKRGWEIP